MSYARDENVQALAAAFGADMGAAQAARPVSILDFDLPPPGEDASAVLAQALTEVAAITPADAGARTLDLAGRVLDLRYPVDVPGAYTCVRNGALKVMGSASTADWTGGSGANPDGSAPRKGVLRFTASYCQTRDLRLFPNQMGNGVEDVGTTGHYHSNIWIVGYKDYGLRYAAPSGGGFWAIRPRMRKMSIGDARMYDADQNTGYGLLLQANDAIITDATFYGGERGIFQAAGCGTAQFSNVHCWNETSTYTRQVSGSAPVTLDFQLGHLGGAAFDASKVSVALNSAGYPVVTPLSNLTTPATLTFRRDPVDIEMRGWGSDWNNLYIDTHKVRLWGDRHRVHSFAIIQPPAGERDCVFELVPTQSSTPARGLILRGENHKDMPVLARAFPNPSNPTWAWDADPAALAGYQGTYSDAPIPFSVSSGAVVAQFFSRNSNWAMLSVAKLGASDPNRHQYGTDGTDLVGRIGGSVKLRVTQNGLQLQNHTTGGRPSGLGAGDAGLIIFDTTLSRPVLWTGSAWIVLGVAP